MNRAKLDEAADPGNNHAEAGAMGPDGGLAEGFDLAALQSLLEKSIKAQEREAYKQEQRWRGVQIQLNQLQDDFEVERRGELQSQTHYH